MPMGDFKKTMLSLLDIVNQKNKNISLLGDFNIDLLNARFIPYISGNLTIGISDYT